MVRRLVSKAEFNTNSLRPLRNDTSLRILGETFKVNKNQVTAIKDKLFILGVFNEVRSSDGKRVLHFWSLNPYLAFKGRFVPKRLVSEFYHTLIARYCRYDDPDTA